MTVDTIIDFADFWQPDIALHANDEETAERLATEQLAAHLGRRLLVIDTTNSVQAFLRCEEHPDASVGYGDEHCPHLEPHVAPGDAGAAHDITAAAAAAAAGVVVEVVGASELMGGGWDDEEGFVYPQWDVDIVTANGLLCDGKPIDARLIFTPWLTLPAIGRSS
jgi:hypothetical protein